MKGIDRLCKRLTSAHKKRLKQAAKLKKMKAKDRRNLRSFKRGKALYHTLCFTCHGEDGLAVAVGASKKAANFRDSVRLRYARSDDLIKTVLHGLTGTVSGHEHSEVMVPMKSYDDKTIAGVLNYIRNSFGNEQGYIDSKAVARVRKKTKSREKPYTERDLLHERPAYKAILAAVPAEAPAAPAKRRRVIVFSDARGHRAPVARGILALEAMAAKTGAFEVVFSDRLSDFEASNLASYDAVFLNNASDIEWSMRSESLRAALLDFVRNGGGLAAIHAAADGGWKEFTEMLGGKTRGQPWRKNKQWGLRIEDPDHPLMRPFGGVDFKMKESLYRFKAYERANVRVLLSVDLSVSADKNTRKDRDNPLAWVRKYGEGRVFYSAFGHHDKVFENPAVIAHWLAGIQFVLGDLDVPTESLPQPSRR